MCKFRARATCEKSVDTNYKGGNYTLSSDYYVTSNLWKRTMHLGLIGGIGPAATEFYYRGLIKAYASADLPLDLTIAHANSLDLRTNLTNEAPQKQADLFLKFTKRLQAAGADAVAVTSLAGHFCINELVKASPLPVLSAIPAIGAFLAKNNITRVGLVGTRKVMETHWYGGLQSVEVVLPLNDDFQATHDNYVTMAGSGQATNQQRDFFLSLGERMCTNQGAEAILLGGTDLFLAFNNINTNYRVIDCAEIHINSLVKY
jgi:aspartate racemase